MDWLGILLVLVWLIAGGVNAAQKKKRQQSPELPPPPPRRPVRSTLPEAVARPPIERKRQSVLDLLREEMERMQREGEAARTTQGPMGRRVVVQWPGAEEVEDLESLEVEPEVASIEVAERITSREVVDQDDQAEAVVRRRIEAAQSRDRALTVADHKAFDRTIRGSVPAQPAVPIVGRRPASIRDAMVWREILGPPKGLQ
jgi:hypothetical protein